MEWITDCIAFSLERGRDRGSNQRIESGQRTWKARHLEESGGGHIACRRCPIPGIWARNVPGKPLVFMPLFTSGMGTLPRPSCDDTRQRAAIRDFHTIDDTGGNPPPAS